MQALGGLRQVGLGGIGEVFEARLVGTGAYSSVAEACDATIQVAETFPVDPEAKRFYDASYPTYRGLYGDLKARFAEMAALVHGA